MTKITTIGHQSVQGKERRVERNVPSYSPLQPHRARPRRCAEQGALTKKAVTGESSVYVGRRNSQHHYDTNDSHHDHCMGKNITTAPSTAFTHRNRSNSLENPVQARLPVILATLTAMTIPMNSERPGAMPRRVVLATEKPTARRKGVSN